VTPARTATAFAATAAEMKELGAALAALVRPGDTVLLGGELGAGKTTFTQGLASALGAVGPVTSPTFVLVHTYRTALGWDLLHADVWRLEQLQEVIDLAIAELVEEGAAAVVEWGEVAAPALSRDCLHVAIAFSADAAGPGRRPQGAGPSGGTGSIADDTGAEGVRRVVFTPLGPSWLERAALLPSAREL